MAHTFAQFANVWGRDVENPGTERTFLTLVHDSPENTRKHRIVPGSPATGVAHLSRFSMVQLYYFDTGEGANRPVKAPTEADPIETRGWDILSELSNEDKATYHNQEHGGASRSLFDRPMCQESRPVQRRSGSPERDPS